MLTPCQIHYLQIPSPVHSVDYLFLLLMVSFAVQCTSFLNLQNLRKGPGTDWVLWSCPLNICWLMLKLKKLPLLPLSCQEDFHKRGGCWGGKMDRNWPGPRETRTGITILASSPGLSHLQMGLIKWSPTITRMRICFWIWAGNKWVYNSWFCKMMSQAFPPTISPSSRRWMCTISPGAWLKSWEILAQCTDFFFSPCGSYSCCHCMHTG